MTRTELTELVLKAQKGDNSAVEQIYLLTHNSVFNKIYASINNTEDAEDVLQNCYLTLIEKIGELKNPESFEKWFNTIVANKVKDHKRKKAPVLLDDGDFNPLSNYPEEDTNSIPHESVEHRENVEAIRKIINGLPDKNRQTIEMHYLEDKSVSEIADELGVPENTVKTRLRSGRKNIRKALLTILIIVLVLIATLFTVTSSPEIFSNIIYHFRDDYVIFGVDNIENIDYPETILQEYMLGYIPEGYELFEKSFSPEGEDIFFVFERHRKGDSQIIFKQLLLDNTGVFDNEGTVSEVIQVNGNEILRSKNELDTHYHWDNGEYIFVVTVSSDTMPYEEEIKIIEGITTKPVKQTDV